MDFYDPDSLCNEDGGEISWNESSRASLRGAGSCFSAALMPWGGNQSLSGVQVGGASCGAPLSGCLFTRVPLTGG